MDLIVKRGDTFKLTFSFMEEDPPISLSGCTARLFLKYIRTDELIIDASTENELLTVDEESKAIILEIPGYIMSNVPIGRHKFDLRLFLPDDIIKTTNTRYVNVIRDITTETELINFSGWSGVSGWSGAGISGYSGWSGVSGWSGAGISGYSGWSGAGISGYSGWSGAGISGYSGWSGVSGWSGIGISGWSGVSGWSGIGISGWSGVSGFSGAPGTGGIASWVDYVFNWAIEPELQEIISSGEVYKYTYDNTIAYRLIPTDGTSVDSFYSNFSNSILTNLLAQRGNL